MSPATPLSVSRAIDELPAGTRYEIGFPLDILPGTDTAALAQSLLEDGLTRVRVGERIETLTPEGSALCGAQEGKRNVDAIIDRLVRGKDVPERRLDSIETAFARGLGRCCLILDGTTRTFVRGWRCSVCGTDHIEPQVNLFRYQSPLGACPRCEGLGQVIDLDFDRIVPDRSKSIREGAIAPWNNPAYRGLLAEPHAPSFEPGDSDQRALRAARPRTRQAPAGGSTRLGLLRPGRFLRASRAWQSQELRSRRF